jgi:succinate-acetate transporter protein
VSELREFKFFERWALVFYGSVPELILTALVWFFAFEKKSANAKFFVLILVIYNVGTLLVFESVLLLAIELLATYISLQLFFALRYIKRS